jgi:predicted phage terminase large subunit-like protein
MMLAPRFHAKSTCFTIMYPLWKILQNPNIRIMIVSANQEIAVSFVRAIIQQLENNQDIRDEFGILVPEQPKKWGERAFIVERDTTEKDPTVVGIGVGGKLISRRADIIIIDDLIDMENARTKQARAKTQEWFENVLLPILEDDGQLIIAGTAWYEDDLYDKLWKTSKFDIRLKLKALIWNEKYRDAVGKQGTMHIPYNPLEFPLSQKIQDIATDEIIQRYDLYQNLKGGVLWEDKWSFPKLMAKKEDMTNASFMRQYLNEATSDEERPFKESYLNKSKTNRFGLVTSWDNANPPITAIDGSLVVSVGVDLAISKKRDADESAIAVWGLDERRRRIFLWAEKGKWSPEETKQRVADINERFHPVKIRVENVAFQDMLRQELADDDIPVEGFHTTAQKKFNEETGLASIAMLMEQGNVLIPVKSAGTPEAHMNIVRELLAEMTTYTYDQHAGDLLMASWFAIDGLRDYDKKMRDNRGFFSTSAMVDSLRNVRAAHKIMILKTKPQTYKFIPASLVYIFRNVPNSGHLILTEPIAKPGESFFIFATREQKTVGFVLEKHTLEIVARVEGDISVMLSANLLETVGHFFNDAQLIIDRNGEGNALFFELQKRMYPELLCLQPGSDGYPTLEEGFKISDSSLPIAMDTFKMKVDKLEVKIPDDGLLKDMGELLSVEGDKLNMSSGTGQRIKTVAIALWLIESYDNYERSDHSTKGVKTKKELKVPYRIFHN